MARRAGASGETVDRTRPVYAYPKVARHVGTGSIDDDASFAPADPAELWPSSFEWLGASFFSAGHELWCTASGARFDCSRSR